jgi:hypothetical protein
MRLPKLKAEVLGVLVGVILVAFAAHALRAPLRSRSQFVPQALGGVLPPLEMETLGSTRASLQSRLGQNGTLILVVGTRDCVSCSNLGVELSSVHHDIPTLRTLVIGSGDGAAGFRGYFDRLGIDSIAVIDSGRVLLHALHLANEPVTILVDSSMRVLMIDSRGTSEAAQFPIGMILTRLRHALMAR